MAKRHRELLARLDPVGLNRYQIIEKELRTIERYLHILQSHLKTETTWDELKNYAGYYGTSIAIHEIVEIRALQARGIEPVRYKLKALQAVLQQHIDTHALAIYEEHLYIQEVIHRVFGASFQVGTLIVANRSDESDIEVMLESDIGLFIVEDHRLSEAEECIEEMKGLEI